MKDLIAEIFKKNQPHITPMMEWGISPGSHSWGNLGQYIYRKLRQNT